MSFYRKVFHVDIPRIKQEIKDGIEYYCEWCDFRFKDESMIRLVDGKLFCSDDCVCEYEDDCRLWENDYVRDVDGSVLEFADPGGVSALRAATSTNPRIYSCPTCGSLDRLTKKDKQLGYQCDSCSNIEEGISGYGDY